MKNQPRTSISLLAAVVLTLMAMVAPALAHGGFDHVRGTVVSASNNMITVKTSSGTVDVKLDGRTKFTKNGQNAQLSDLAAGSRVIIEIPNAKGSDKVAQSVTIGAASPAPGAGKQPAKK